MRKSMKNIIATIKNSYTSFSEMDEAVNTLLNMEYENRRLRQVNERYRAATSKFIFKVDNGMARSTETYLELKECLELDNGTRPK